MKINMTLWVRVLSSIHMIQSNMAPSSKEKLIVLFAMMKLGWQSQLGCVSSLATCEEAADTRSKYDAPGLSGLPFSVVPHGEAATDGNTVAQWGQHPVSCGWH